MPPSKTVSVLVLVVAAAVASASAARSPEPRLRLDVRLEAPPEFAAQAAAVRAALQDDLTAVADLLGVTGPVPPLRLVLAGERSDLARRAPSWVSGYALPPLATIVVFPGRVPSYPDHSTANLLRHEIAHVLLARAAGGGEVPRWFDEGAATVAAREWGIEDGARAAIATIGHGPRSLAEVNACFAGDATDAARGYAVASALVRSLLRRHGELAVARVLSRVAAGMPFAEAFAAATGEPLDEFARGYFRRETVWTAWVPFVTSTTVLWMGITLLALFAIRRRRERDEQLRVAWAEEEMRSRAPAAPEPPLSDDDPMHWN